MNKYGRPNFQDLRDFKTFMDCFSVGAMGPMEFQNITTGTQ